MERMTKLCSIALAALALGGMGLTPAEAAYKPKITSKMGGQAVKDAQKAVASLKSMPKPVRWTFLAEKLGILFMPPQGRIGHEYSDGHMLVGSHFIGVDGMEYDAKSEYNARPSAEAWTFCAGRVDRLGCDVIFSKLSSEVTALVLANAKYHLEKMAEEMPEMRDMYLAFIAELCYLPNGKSPYDTLTTAISPNKQKFQVHEIEKRGCKFVDTRGVEHAYDDVHTEYARFASQRWFILHVHTNLVGAKDILALYPEEVKTLRANYKKKMQELGAGATEPKEDKAEEPSEPSAKAEALAKKFGVTYLPKTNADRMGGQFKNDMRSVRKYLDSLSKSQRWFFMAERLGLLFMPKNDGSGAYSDLGWYKAGAHFIGANGLEYDALAELDVINNKGTRAEWNKNSEITMRLGREVVLSQFPEEVAELVLQNAKYQLDKIAGECPESRDAVLARIAQLEYLPDGTSPYVLRPWKGPHGDMVNEYKMDAPWQKYYFTDTEGKEQLTDSAYRRIKGRWVVLVICAHHLGKDAILALCPKEVKKLRANYEKRVKELKK